MIVDNSPNRSYIFPLFLDQGECRGSKELPDLVKMDGSEYPKNPKGGKYKTLWTSNSMTDLIMNKNSNTPFRVLICNQLESLLYTLATKDLKRISKHKESFIKAVIHLSLSNGFDGSVITFDDRDLIRFGLKKDAARNTLKALHDQGIIIYMQGYGYYELEIQKTAPAAFMLYPEMEKLIGHLITQLECCKLSIADIKEIQLPKDLIIKR